MFSHTLKPGFASWLREGGPALVAPIASGLMLGFVFEQPSLSCLAWIALAPLAAVLHCRGRRTEIYLGTFAGGVAFHLLALDFLRYDPYVAMDSLWLSLGYLLTPFLLGVVWVGAFWFNVIAYLLLLHSRQRG